MVHHLSDLSYVLVVVHHLSVLSYVLVVVHHLSRSCHIFSCVLGPLVISSHMFWWWSTICHILSYVLVVVHHLSDLSYVLVVVHHLSYLISLVICFGSGPSFVRLVIYVVMVVHHLFITCFEFGSWVSQCWRMLFGGAGSRY